MSKRSRSPYNNPGPVSKKFNMKSTLALEMQSKEEAVRMSRTLLESKLSKARESLDEREEYIRERYRQLGENYKSDTPRRHKNDNEQSTSKRYSRGRSYTDRRSNEGKRSENNSRSKNYKNKTLRSTWVHDNYQEHDKEIDRSDQQIDSFLDDINEINFEESDFRNDNNDERPSNHWEEYGDHGDYKEDEDGEETHEYENGGQQHEQHEYEYQEDNDLTTNDGQERSDGYNVTETRYDSQAGSSRYEQEPQLQFPQFPARSRSPSPSPSPHGSLKRNHRKAFPNKFLMKKYFAQYCNIAPHPDIPCFDNTDQALNSFQMIDIIKNLSKKYNWADEIQKYQLVVKLVGNPRDWVFCQKRILLHWTKLRYLFLDEFQSDMSYCNCLSKMLKRTQGYRESYWNYFKSKLDLVQKCSLEGRKAVSCLIGGLNSKEVRQNCYVQNFATTDELLEYLDPRSEPNQISSQRLRPISPESLTVRINSHTLNAFNDSHSEHVTIKEEDAHRIQLFYERCRTTVIGYKGVPILTFGECRTILNVQDVSVNIQIYIVPNASQETSVVLGKSLRTHPEIEFCQDTNQFIHTVASTHIVSSFDFNKRLMRK